MLLSRPISRFCRVLHSKRYKANAPKNFYHDVPNPIKRAIMRFFITNPKRLPYGLAYIFLGLLLSQPIYFMYLKTTMDRDEFIDYYNRFQAVQASRRQSLSNLYIPFWNKNIAIQQNEKSAEVYKEIQSKKISRDY